MWKTRIITAISTMPKGAIVELNQLLAGYWASLTNPEKQKLGKWFFSEVNSGTFPNIQWHHKNTANHAFYEII